MPLDVNVAPPDERTRWIDLPAQYAGVQLLIRMASPREQERVKQKMVSVGIVNQKSQDIAPGRFDDFVRQFAKSYIVDWRGDISPEGAKYSVDVMAKHLADSQFLLKHITAAVSEEAAFLAVNGNG